MKKLLNYGIRSGAWRKDNFLFPSKDINLQKVDDGKNIKFLKCVKEVSPDTVRKE